MCITDKQRQEYFNNANTQEKEFLQTQLALQLGLQHNNLSNKYAPDFCIKKQTHINQYGWPEYAKEFVELKTENFQTGNLAIEEKAYKRAQREQCTYILHHFPLLDITVAVLIHNLSLTSFFGFCKKNATTTRAIENQSANGKIYANVFYATSINKLKSKYPDNIFIFKNSKTELIPMSYLTTTITEEKKVA